MKTTVGSIREKVVMVLESLKSLWFFPRKNPTVVMCDVGYLNANFGLPRVLCSRLRPYVRDRRQTDRCQTNASLNSWVGCLFVDVVYIDERMLMIVGLWTVTDCGRWSAECLMRWRHCNGSNWTRTDWGRSHRASSVGWPASPICESATLYYRTQSCASLVQR